MQYLIPVTIENDTDLKNKEIAYCIDCAPYNVSSPKPIDIEEKFPIIQYQENGVSKVTSKRITYIYPKFDVKTIELNQPKVDFDFIYTLGTNSFGAVKHIFKLVE